MSRIVIVRHGNTFEAGEPPRRIGSRTDLPLVASGRDQAARLRQAFRTRSITFDEVWTGPLGRARETTEILVAEQPLPLRTADWLDEIDHGPDEGATEAAVITRIGRPAIDAWDCAAVVPPAWIVDPARRAAAWQSAMARQAGREGTSLFVTSNGAARYALTHPDLEAAAERMASRKLRTGAYGILMRETGKWRLAEWDSRPDPAVRVGHEPD